MEQKANNSAGVCVGCNDLFCGQVGSSAMELDERRDSVITLYCVYGNHDFIVSETGSYNVTRKYHICDKCRVERQRY